MPWISTTGGAAGDAIDHPVPVQLELPSFKCALEHPVAHPTVPAISFTGLRGHCHETTQSMRIRRERSHEHAADRLAAGVEAAREELLVKES